MKESPSQNPIFQGQLRLLSFARAFGHNPRQRNGGFRLFDIQVNYSGWPHRYLDLHYYTDAGIYPGYSFSNHGEWLVMPHSLP